MTMPQAAEIHELLDAEEQLELARATATAILDGLRGVIHGQESTLADVVAALLAGGHLLLEGAPGLGKTQIVRTLATLVSGSFARIQFTPDLMPSDVLGVSFVVGGADGEKAMRYREGPIFANLVLADEINRATPKTQSALLEAMAERTVSVEGRPRPLPRPFFVMATENPIEMEGVFPLPEAQLDRFLMKLVLRMPDLPTLARIGARAAEPAPPAPVASVEELLVAQRVAQSIASAPHVERYAAELVMATHAVGDVRWGAGPRAAQALMACGRARALVDGRAAVGIDDLRAVAPQVLRHRLVMAFDAQLRGIDPEQVVAQVIASTPAP